MRTVLVMALAGVTISGCGTTGGVLSLAPFAKITAVQLFDQPNFTVAFSIDGAVSNSSLVSKVNWVFGDGGGFVEGPAGRTSITHVYLSTGTFEVTAFVFGPSGFVDQLNGSVTVLPSSGGTPGTPGATELPGQISNPSPAKNATDVIVQITLGWSAAAGAESYDVYLGTDQAAVTAATTGDIVNFRGNQTSNKFDPPGDLAANTTYFWRIDAVNGAGTTKGVINQFKTAKAPTSAKDPIPANGSTTARVTQIVRWTAGLRTTSHDVYFSKNALEIATADRETVDVFQGNQTSLSFDPTDEDSPVTGELLPLTTYFWRIDEVGPGGTLTGAIWSFTTAAAPVGITSPQPADVSTDIALDVVLSWQGASTIESYDVFFGTGEIDVELATRTSPEFRGNRTTKDFTPGNLLPGLDYFWRIDTLGPGGTSKGVVLKFTTAFAPAAPINFTPVHQAVDIAVDTNLDWDIGVGGGATNTFDIYLSTDQAAVNSMSAAAFKASQPAAQSLFDPSPTNINLPANTIHFWRIVAVGPGGKTPAAVQRFTTGILAQKALSPIPAHNATAIPLDLDDNDPGTPLNGLLEWIAGANALSHDVYFGTDENAVRQATHNDVQFKGNQAGTTFDPGPLLASTNYFWRIDEVATGGPTTGDVWKFHTGPGQAVNPNPQHDALDILTTTPLGWTAGPGTNVTHDVYFGDDLTAVTNADRLTPTIFRGNQTATTFAPSLLESNKEYFWRIDEVSTANNITEITKGQVWKFLTILGKATTPVPSHDEKNVSLTAQLSWSRPTSASSLTHDVYFGTIESAVNLANSTDPLPPGVISRTLGLTVTTFNPGTLTANTVYFWRVDEVVATGPIGTRVKKGDIWKFTTLAPPQQVSGPSPANGATNVNVNTVLSWGASQTATSYDVYFGTVSPGVFQGNQPGTTYNPGALTANTDYFWRIDPKNDAGTTTGQVFTFKTAP